MTKLKKVEVESVTASNEEQASNHQGTQKAGPPKGSGMTILGGLTALFTWQQGVPIIAAEFAGTSSIAETFAIYASMEPLIFLGLNVYIAILIAALGTFMYGLYSVWNSLWG